MALVMKRGTHCVRFEVADEEVESTVTLLPEDDEQTLVRKLRRVIALVEPEAPAELPFDFAKIQMLKEAAASVALDRGRIGTRYASEPPEIPDRLKGEVELDEAGLTTGNGWKDLGDGEGLPNA